jgi:hypothetical protein
MTWAALHSYPLCTGYHFPILNLIPISDFWILILCLLPSFLGVSR